MIKFNLIVTSFFLLQSFLQAQNSFLIINKEENLLYESELVNHVDTFHSSIYPRSISSVVNYKEVQSSLLKEGSGFSNYLGNRYPVNISGKSVSTRIVPLVNLGFSKDFSDNDSPQATGGGLLLHSDLGKRVSVQFSFYGAQQSFGIDQKRQIDSTHILPQIGEYNINKDGVYSYTNWEGYITYKAFSFLNFQVGKDQNFIGDGYRSLLLSDNSSPYPFAKATVSVGKIKYMVLYQFLKDVDTEFYTYPNEKKYSTTHFLSLNIGKRININLFETVIWRDQLESGVKRGYDFNYMNPIIFYRPVEYSIGSPDNMIMGGGFRFRMFKKSNFYGQLVLDEFKLKEVRANAGWWANKYGYQIGLKIYDLFGAKNLFVLGEYNTVRPFTYSHGSSMKSYGNMYQPLAHPLGANFKEVIALANYQKNRWQLQGKISFAKIGLDKDSVNYGQNMYRSYNDNRQEYGNFTLQGELTQIINAEAKIAYIINPLWNLRLETGLRLYRYSNSKESLSGNTIFISLKTLF